jgi:hypothetical protein
MTQTTHTDNVLIDGSRDITQLQVEGHSTQNQPLQTWQANGATPVAHVAKDGRLQTGTLGLGTPDALVEANLDNTTQPALPKRGVQSLGKLTGALASAIDWAVHELELLGTGGVSALITAVRARVTHKNSGSSGSAELRAADFQALNQTGTVGTPVGRVTGVRGTASNTPLVSGTAYLAKAIGVEATVTNDASGTVTEAAAFEVAPPTNSGTITTLYGVRVPDLTQGQTNYAIHTAQGLAHFGDAQEVKVFASAPTGNPPSNFVKVYPKLVTGAPHLFAKDSTGTEYDMSGSGGDISTAAILAPASSTRNVIQPTGNFKALIVKNHASQAVNPLEVQDSAGTPFAAITAGGKLGLGTASPGQLLDLTSGHLRFTPLTAPAAPTVAVNPTAGNLNGSYTYRISYVTAAGETSLSNMSSSVSPVNQQVTVTLPIGPAGIVTQRKIFRSLPSGFAWYYIATVADNTTTTYVDNIADGSLVDDYTSKDNTTSGAFFLGTERAGLLGNTNVGLGRNTLTSLISGINNTAIGNGALRFITKGINSTAIGSDALTSNTTGTLNTAVGASALTSNSTGNSNSAVGFHALNSNSTGGENTAVGRQALRSSSTGSGNTALGYGAGYTATTGNANTTGSNNTFIGYNAGPGTSTQLNNATALGYNALVSASSALVLGGTGSDAVKVGIGITTPTAQLDVRLSAAANLGQVIRAAASQTGNLQEWQNSGGTRLSGVDSTGRFIQATLAGTPTGTPTAGTMVYDTTANKLWVYSGSSWRSVAMT